MGAVEAIRNLYEYNEWANGQVLAAASKLSEGGLQRDLGASYGSVSGSLGHLAGAQIVWLARWRSLPLEDVVSLYAPLMLLEEGARFEAVRETLERSDAALRRFMESLTEDELMSDLAYVDGRGVSRSRPLWQLMMGVANHGTQFRSEAATALTSLGSSPGDLDYGHFVDIRPSKAPGTLAMIRGFYEYNEWANARILETMSGLGDEELMRPRAVSHGSLGMDLLHGLRAQVGWLSTFRGGAPRIPLPAPEGASFLDNLIDWYRRSHEALREFIDSLGEEELGRSRIDNPQGTNRRVKQSRSLLLWDMMVHVVNHGTQHRSEAAMALTELGRSPGDLDYMYFEYRRS